MSIESHRLQLVIYYTPYYANYMIYIVTMNTSSIVQSSSAIVAGINPFETEPF